MPTVVTVAVLLAAIALAVWACRKSPAAAPKTYEAEADAALLCLCGRLPAELYDHVHAHVTQALAQAHAEGLALGAGIEWRDIP